MSSDKIRRNAPCPCGSGKKYKHCCGGQTQGHASAIGSDLQEAMAGRDFADMDEVQAFADAFMQQSNDAPSEDFDGLSPAQMSALLYAPFDSPQCLRFAETLAVRPEAPIMTLFERLVDAIGDGGLKATAKGNLPRALCQAAVRDYEGLGDDDLRLVYGSVNKEDDFYDLHITRLVAQAAGLIRKYKGRFVLTRKCRTLREPAGSAGVYPRLLQTHAVRFNWAYGDGYPDLGFIQQAFAFTLYLLSRHGGSEQSQRFYEDAFLRAFPTLLDEVEPRPYSSAEAQLRRCYTLRTLVRFAGFLGLARLTPTGTDILTREYIVTETPLLGAIVDFHWED